jgi:glycosyltransferase involved in cell wall biosynthesis
MTIPHFYHKAKVMIGTPVLLVGGTEIHVLNLIRGLQSAGYQISVCCYYEYETSMVRQVEEAGAKVILMGLRRTDGMLTLLNNLRKLFKEQSPDIVHVQYLAPGLIPIIAAKLAGAKKIFATVHQPGRPYGLKAKLLIRSAACLCNAFFCNSKSVEESWFEDSELFDPEKINLERKHFTIYNGVDVEKMKQIVDQTYQKKLRQSLNMEDKKVVGVVGRLRREKGQEVLLNAIPEVIRSISNVILVVIGDGPDREVLESRAKNLDIPDHVLWLGEKDQKEVFQLYSIMDVVAIPSLFEGFGLIATEAMAAGRPVVGSRVDGLSEIIDDGVTGYLHQVGDSHELANALIHLLSNEGKGKKMGERGRERVQELFSMHHFVRSFISVYENFS